MCNIAAIERMILSGKTSHSIVNSGHICD